MYSVLKSKVPQLQMVLNVATRLNGAIKSSSTSNGLERCYETRWCKKSSMMFPTGLNIALNQIEDNYTGAGLRFTLVTFEIRRQINLTSVPTTNNCGILITQT